MASEPTTKEPGAPTAPQFATTHWSTVLAAGAEHTPESQEALARLCRSYWFPLYAYARHRGHPPEDARDFTQAFFERLLEKHQLRHAAPHRGRFRSFLLGAFQNFLHDQHDRASALKRGGGLRFVPWHHVEAETRFEAADAASESPEALFDRAWAEAVVQGSVQALRADFEAAGQGALFQAIKGCLSSPADHAAYKEIGERLGLSADAVSMAVMRLRREYRIQVRAEVARTVATPAEIDDEMRYLVDLLVR